MRRNPEEDEETEEDDVGNEREMRMKMRRGIRRKGKRSRMPGKSREDKADSTSPRPPPHE